MKNPKINFLISRNHALFLILFLLSCKSSFTAKDKTVSVSPVKDQVADTKMQEMISPYSQKMKLQMDEVIGEAADDLEIGIPQGKLGNYVSDLMLKYAQEKIDPAVQIALVGNGGLRSPIRKGKITIGNIFELMPFDNELVVLSLRGSTLDSLVSYVTSVFINQNNVKSVFPFGGLVINLKKTGAYSVLLNDKPIDPKAVYKMVTNDYLANGGDNMTLLLRAVDFQQSGILMRDMLINSVRQSKTPLSAETDMRFIVEF